MELATRAACRHHGTSRVSAASLTDGRNTNWAAAACGSLITEFPRASASPGKCGAQTCDGSRGVAHSRDTCARGLETVPRLPQNQLAATQQHGLITASSIHPRSSWSAAGHRVPPPRSLSHLAETRRRHIHTAGARLSKERFSLSLKILVDGMLRYRGRRAMSSIDGAGVLPRRTGFRGRVEDRTSLPGTSTRHL